MLLGLGWPNLDPPSADKALTQRFFLTMLCAEGRRVQEKGVGAEISVMSN
jgi:hypothetical protein